MQCSGEKPIEVNGVCTACPSGSFYGGFNICMYCGTGTIYDAQAKTCVSVPKPICPQDSVFELATQ